MHIHTYANHIFNNACYIQIHMRLELSEIKLLTGGWCTRSCAREGWIFPNSAQTGNKFDFVLLAYFALWYLGNYYYNITNK